MDKLGEIWASLLESLLSNRFDDALNEFMRLTNASSRMQGMEAPVGAELQKEAESRFVSAIAKEIQKICKSSIARARNGDLSTAITDANEAVSLLRIRVGADLISKHGSGTSTSKECREPIKQMLIAQLTIRCVQATNELRGTLEVKRKAKSTATHADDGFLEAIQAVMSALLTSLAFCFGSEVAFGSAEDSQFFPIMVKDISHAGGKQIGQIVSLFMEDRRIKSFWFKRADELGGLTLPNAMKQPSSNTTGRSKPTATPVEPLDDSESASLDLALHEISQILSMVEELSDKSVLQDTTIELVSALVRLDELWLTHNITKAVTHAISYEIESPIVVNSIAEDVFHVATTSFARAVNSQSLFAVEASANHVAGFIAEGFVDILREFIRRDSPRGDDWLIGDDDDRRRNPNTLAAQAASSMDTSSKKNVDDGSYSATFIEAINTVASACVHATDFKAEANHAFENIFGRPQAMAPGIIAEALQKMELLLDESCQVLAKQLLSPKALNVILRRFDPRDGPFEINVTQFERESIAKTSWVRDFIDAQFRRNIPFRESIPAMSLQPACKVVALMLKSVCDTIEKKIDGLRFSALGALQLDKDLRALCESSLGELNSLVANEGDAADTRNRFDTSVRPQFKRLRHWTFLLNLQRASDEKEYDFPAKVLSEEDVARVLLKRTEKDFFS